MKRLGAVGQAGEKLLIESAKLPAHDPNKKRRVLILQHYDQRCSPLVELFASSFMGVNASYDHIDQGGKEAPSARLAADRLDIHCA